MFISLTLELLTNWELLSSLIEFRFLKPECPVWDVLTWPPPLGASGGSSSGSSLVYPWWEFGDKPLSIDEKPSERADGFFAIAPYEQKVKIAIIQCVCRHVNIMFAILKKLALTGICVLMIYFALNILRLNFFLKGTVSECLRVDVARGWWNNAAPCAQCESYAQYT